MQQITDNFIRKDKQQHNKVMNVARNRFVFEHIELKLGENRDTEDSTPILLVSDMEMNSYVKGYHAYKHLWTPVINEHLSNEMEPNNIKDR